MSLDALNNAAASRSGTWVNLKTKADGVLEGALVDFEIRDKTFEGEVVLGRKSGKPRKEWVVTVKVDDDQLTDPSDDGLRKIGLPEGGQSALSAALSAADAKAEVGGRLKIGIGVDKDESPSGFAEWRARYTPPVKTLDVPGSDFDEDDF